MEGLLIKKKLMSIPIIQGGMGIGVSMGGLAGAVASYGGMGVISTADAGYQERDFYTDPDAANTRGLIKAIDKARKIISDKKNSCGLLAINAMVATRNYERMVRQAVQNGIDAVISGAGLPLELPEYVKGSDTAIAPVVSSGRAIKTICKLWDRRYSVSPDFVVIEGSRAGGHLGFSREELDKGTAKTLKDILPDVLSELRPYEEKYAKKIPVFVAGGIYDRFDIEEVMALGASGVQMATRFIVTEECDASVKYKEQYLKCDEQDIVLVNSPVGMPGRALRTPLVEKLGGGFKIPPKHCTACLVPCRPADTTYCITQALIEAVNGNVENGLFFCGSNAYRLDRIMPVKELLEELTGHKVDN